MSQRSYLIYIPRLYGLLISFIIARHFIESISTTASRAIECFLLVVSIYYYIKCYSSTKSVGKYIHIMLTLLLICNLFIVIRGNWGGGLKEIIFKIIDLRGVVVYLLPFLFFLPYNSFVVKNILRVFFYASLFTIPLWIINKDHLIQTGISTSYRSEGIGGYLPFLAAFLLPLTVLFAKKESLIIKIIFGTYFLLMLINARRNICFSFFCYTIIAYYVQYRFLNLKQSGVNTILLVCVFFLGLIVMINLDSLTKGPFNYLATRMNEDSRSGVEEFFFADFSSSSRNDWLLGRGMDGTYYQEMRDQDTGQIETQRSVIETGYLDLLLKGGIIYDLLIMMILIPAIYKGLKSKKIIKFSCGLFLSTYLIDLYSTSPLSTLGVRTILFWFCISVCYRREQFISRRLKNVLTNRYKVKVVLPNNEFNIQ